MLLSLLKSTAVGLLTLYLRKLATQEFAHWALMKVAQAIVESTKTKEDDKWLEKIKETIEKK